MSPDVSRKCILIDALSMRAEKTTEGHMTWGQSTLLGVKNFIAGTCAGMAECLVGHPLDTVKVRVQTAGGSLYPVLASTIKNEGFFALYRGASSRVAGSAFTNSVLFGVNGEFRSLLGADTTQPWTARFMLAGALTGAVEAFVFTPTDLIKTRCQVEYGRVVDATPLKVARMLVKQHGVIKGLFSGFGPTLVRESTGNMVYFGVYECTKRYIMALRGLQEGDILTFIGAGGCAGLSYWTAVYPVDTLKSIIQSRDMGGVSAFKVAADLYKDKGIRAFYRGLSVAQIRAFPACAATFTSFEYASRAIDWVAGVNHSV